MVENWQLRAAFARSLSAMYGREVPAYLTLQQVCAEINAEVLRRDGADAERLGTIDRVTAERHGAIRVGTAKELRDVSRIFAALGMYPVGFYDLRDASKSAVPVVSTAFRPVDSEELARNPFRVFTSVLTTDDHRFFDADLQQQLGDFLAARQLFAPELLGLADRAATEGGLDEPHASRFLELATSCFALSSEPIDANWHERLQAVSSVAADIGAMRSTHINHLTPRVLDIDKLYRRMQTRGIEMIDAIQGPPRWDGPDVLLRQTSFRALPEPRQMRAEDGTTYQGVARVRFGEVEARGIALTASGRERYDTLLAETERRAAADPCAVRAELAAQVWSEQMPATESALAEQNLAFFTFARIDRAPDGRQPPSDLAGLLARGWLSAEPIVYEDFLPRSAAGIFQSNLVGAGTKRSAGTGDDRDASWLAGVLERPVADPLTLYAAQREQSLRAAAHALELPATPRPGGYASLIS